MPLDRGGSHRPGSSSGRHSPLRRRADEVAKRFGWRRRTAFVLSGGGNLGAVQVGMLRALAEARIVPDIIVGCSVGAINGASFAAEPNLAGVERLDRIWGRLTDGNPELMPSPRFMHVAAQMARKGQAIHDPERLARLLDEELLAKTFEQLQVPFTCVATDLETSDEYWFDTGRLVPALLASAALPAVYPAREYVGRTFIDGGVLREIHTHKALELGATDIYVLHVGHLDERTSSVQRPFDAAVRAYWTARRYRMVDDLRRLPEWCTLHRLPAGSNPRLRFNDFSQGRELARLAYEASREYVRTGHSPVPVEGPVSDDADGADRASVERGGSSPSADTGRPAAGEQSAESVAG